jgi:hypothetical protein
LKIDKLQSVSGSSSAASRAPARERQHARKPHYPPRKEQYSATLLPKAKGKGGRANDGNRLPQGEQLAKLETVAALPHKEGRLDMDAYSKYKEGGLRRKIHDAIREKKCIRCFAEGHLRSSCKEPPRSWEGDFNRGKESFWKPQPKQSRSQWHVYPCSGKTDMLIASLHGKRIVLDTASEVSIGRKSFLKNVRLATTSAFVEGLGGKVCFDLEGDLLLDEKTFITVFAVEEEALPPNSWALIGNGQLRELLVSLDYAQANPGSPLRFAGLEPLTEGSSGPFSSVFGWPSSLSLSSDLFLWTTATALLSVFYLSLAATWTLFSSVYGESLALGEVYALGKSLIILSLSRLVWMALEWLLVPLPSKARPPAGVRERTQPHGAPLWSCRSNASPRMSFGQNARYGAMRKSNSKDFPFRR